MTNYAAGHSAEKAAAHFLKSKSYKLLNLNWSTPYCEIDIVAEKAKTIYFVEVKYRQSLDNGTGFDYITPQKLKQMTFAAEMWVQYNKWTGSYQLAALAITGPGYTNIEFLPDLY